MHAAGGFFLPVNRSDVVKWIERTECLSEAFRYVQDWACAIDVGAFAGVYTRFLAQRFDQVYAIEPNPSSFDCLILNAAQDKNVVCIQAAATDVMGETLLIQKKPWPSARILKKNDKGGREVPTMTLDSLGVRAGLIKMAVEGYEYKVLQGGEKTLAHKPVVIVEAKGHYRRYALPDPVDYLQGRGMKIVAEIRPDVVMAW